MSLTGAEYPTQSKNDERRVEMRKLTLGVCMAALLTAGAASAQETVKLGYIDPLSGGGASVGEGGLKTFNPAFPKWRGV